MGISIRDRVLGAAGAGSVARKDTGAVPSSQVANSITLAPEVARKTIDLVGLTDEEKARRAASGLPKKGQWGRRRPVSGSLKKKYLFWFDPLQISQVDRLQKIEGVATRSEMVRQLIAVGLKFSAAASRNEVDSRVGL